MLLGEQSKFEMEIGPWISMRKPRPGIKGPCAVQGDGCAQTQGTWVQVILGKSSNPYRLSSSLLEEQVAPKGPPALCF